MSALSSECEKDLVLMKDVRVQFMLLYATGACNLLLLILNIAILYAVLSYLKPTLCELRMQTFVIMDNVLLSYIPSSVREVLGCKPDKHDKKKNEKSGKSGKSE